MSPAAYVIAGLLCLAVAVTSRAHSDDHYFRWPVGTDDDADTQTRSRPHAGRGVRVRAAAAAYRFRESLFLLPAVIVLAGVGLAELTGALDDAGYRPPLTLEMTTNAATWLLSTVAGATITTAGVVFSLTVVSLQLASSQFSPRVMRSFIRDRLSQVVIGLLVATFCYSVLTLRRLDGDPQDAAPAVSTTVAVLLTLATVLLIVAHLDHLARRLQVGQVLRSITDEGSRVVADMHRQAQRAQRGPALTRRPEAAGLVVTASKDGWVTQANGKQLLAAVPAGTTLWLETRTGAYVHRGEALCTVWPVPKQRDKVAARIAATVTVDDVRTMQQDTDFAIRQLVDIGLRALSPAVNDPTTAVEVILRLGSLLRRLLESDLVPEVVIGRDDRRLVRPWELRHEEYLAHAFDQLRQQAAPQTQVLAALLRVLRMLLAHARTIGKPQHEKALRTQLDLVLATVRGDERICASDRARLEAMADDRTDPADHSARPPVLRASSRTVLT